jgi:hypothetical protein
MRDLTAIEPEWLSELAPHYYSYGTQLGKELRVEDDSHAKRLRLDDDRKLNIFFADCEEPCARVCVSLSLVASTSADVVCVVCVLNVQLLSAWCKRWA